MLVNVSLKGWLMKVDCSLVGDLQRVDCCPLLVCFRDGTFVTPDDARDRVSVMRSSDTRAGSELAGSFTQLIVQSHVAALPPAPIMSCWPLGFANSS